MASEELLIPSAIELFVLPCLVEEAAIARLTTHIRVDIHASPLLNARTLHHLHTWIIFLLVLHPVLFRTVKQACYLTRVSFLPLVHLMLRPFPLVVLLGWTDEKVLNFASHRHYGLTIALSTILFH